VNNADFLNIEVAARFTASRYFSLMDWTSVNGAGTASQDFTSASYFTTLELMQGREITL
jgi:hypothetical protein